MKFYCQGQNQFAPVVSVFFGVTSQSRKLSSEDIGRIVNPFEQADDSTHRQYEGTGPGLALSEKLVELHGGTFHVVSDGKGKGSEFSFIIPIRSPSPLEHNCLIDLRVMQNWAISGFVQPAVIW